MTLQESLQNLVRFNADTVAALKAEVDQIPAKLAAAEAKAVADYIAAHPEGGSVRDDVLTAAIQTITDQSKDVIAQTRAIPLFMDGAQPPVEGA